MNKTALSFCSLLIAVSCTVGPEYKRPPLYSDAKIQQSLGLSAHAVNPVRLDWYRQFGDPMLDQLVEAGFKYNPDVKVAIQRLREARYTLKINGVNNLPMFNLDGSYHYNKPSRTVGYTIDTDYYQLGLDASWELDIWGSGRKLTESSMALFQAAASSLDNVKLSMTAEIATNYIGLRTAQEQVRIAERNLKLQKDIYETIAAKYKYGLTDPGTLNQARYAVENTQALIPDLKQNEEVYKNALTIMVGKLPGSLENSLADQGHNLIRRRFAFDVNRLYELPVCVIRNRPDVQIAEMQLISHNAQIGQAMAELFPNVSLSGFLGWESLEVSGLIDKKSYMYTYSPAVSLPVFHWGQIRNKIDLEKETTREYFYQYQNSVLAAAGELKNAMSAVTHEYNKNLASYNAAKAQRKVTQVLLDKYQRGLIEFSDVLTAEQNLLSSQVLLVESNGQIYQNIINFYKASGGGYEPKSFSENYMSPLLNGLPCKAR